MHFDERKQVENCSQRVAGVICSMKKSWIKLIIFDTKLISKFNWIFEALKLLEQLGRVVLEQVPSYSVISRTKTNQAGYSVEFFLAKTGLTGYFVVSACENQSGGLFRYTFLTTSGPVGYVVGCWLAMSVWPVISFFFSNET